MNKKILTTGAAVFILTSAVFAQPAMLADWTFETSQPTNSGPYDPETGSGGASGSHASDSTSYTSPAGNGSAHSYTANHWSVGDYWQFSASTIGFQNISVSFNQMGSSTGPDNFDLQYSTNGINFTTFQSYVLPSSVTTWNSSFSNSLSAFSFDLSSVTVLNNVSNIYFRLTDTSTNSVSGGAVGLTGSDHVDNFIVTGIMPPQPTMTIQQIGTNSVVFWNDILFTLQIATNVAGPYADLTNESPFTVPTTNSQLFFRARF